MPIVGSVPIKTIGSKFCVGCVDREAELNGISLDAMIALRKQRREAI